MSAGRPMKPKHRDEAKRDSALKRRTTIEVLVAETEIYYFVACESRHSTVNDRAKAFKKALMLAYNRGRFLSKRNSKKRGTR